MPHLGTRLWNSKHVPRRRRKVVSFRDRAATPAPPRYYDLRKGPAKHTPSQIVGALLDNGPVITFAAPIIYKCDSLARSGFISALWQYVSWSLSGGVAWHILEPSISLTTFDKATSRSAS